METPRTAWLGGLLTLVLVSLVLGLTGMTNGQAVVPDSRLCRQAIFNLGSELRSAVVQNPTFASLLTTKAPASITIPETEYSDNSTGTSTNVVYTITAAPNQSLFVKAAVDGTTCSAPVALRSLNLPSNSNLGNNPNQPHT